MPEGYLIAYPEYGTAVIRKKCRRCNLLTFGIGIFVVELNFLSHVFIQKFLWVEQVIFVILLQNPEAPGVNEGFNMNTRRDYLGSNIPESQFAGPLRQIYSPLVFHKPQVDIVNGYFHTGLVLQSRCKCPGSAFIGSGNSDMGKYNRRQKSNCQKNKSPSGSHIKSSFIDHFFP